MRVLRLLAIVLWAAPLVAAAGAGAGSSETRIYGYRVVDAKAKTALRGGQIPRGFTGGPIVASTGETLNLYAADELLAADPTFSQRWADFMATLLHGPELAELTLFLAPTDRVRQLCGPSTLGCYGGEDETMVAIGQDVRGITAQSVVMHEYGHHVANNRKNDPWDAIDYGTKRWASYVNVCARSEAGELVPGDEGDAYERNPGELFAETYRVLSERRAGLPESSWDVVDESLYPDDTAVALVEQDVAQPWEGNTTSDYGGSFGSRGTGRGYRVPTAYDGVFEVLLTAPARTAYTLRVVNPGDGTVLAAMAGTARVKTVRVSICGERTLQAQVKRISGFGSFTLAVSKP